MNHFQLSRKTMRSTSVVNQSLDLIRPCWLLGGVGLVLLVSWCGGNAIALAGHPSQNIAQSVSQNDKDLQLSQLKEDKVPPEDSAANQPELNMGDQGPLVQQLQFYLKELGYFASEPDGNYGQSTADAVRSLQKRRGLPIDGNMNRATWDVLITDYEVNKIKLSPGQSGVSLPSSVPTPHSTVSLAPVASPGSSPSVKPTEVAPSENPAQDSPATSEQEAPSGFFSRLQSDRGLLFQLSVLTLIGLGLAGSAIVQWVTRKPKPMPSLDPEVDSFRSNLPLNASIETPYPVETVYSASTEVDGFSGEEKIGLDPRFLQTSPLSLSSTDTSRLPVLDKVDQLITHLDSPQVALRHRAIWELGQQADSRAMKPLLDLLPQSDSKQQSLILAAISEIGLKTFKPMKQALAASLDSPNPEVRKNAIRDLQRLYETVLQSSQLLHYAMNDPDPEVQETAKWAIDQLNLLHHTNVPRNLKGKES